MHSPAAASHGAGFARKAGLLLALALLVCGLGQVAAADAATVKPRIVLMHDPELDDENTLIRYLLYTNEFDTEGLMYTSGEYHWAGDGKGTKWLRPGSEPDRVYTGMCPCEKYRWGATGSTFIHDTIDDYAKVYANLKAHDSNYPTPESLKSKVFFGNIEFDGDISKDSAGSNKIKELLLDDKPGPVYLLTGAGQSTIARALKSIKLQYEGTPEWPAIYAKVSRKAIIQSWGDQDLLNAQYIKPNWPDIEWREMRANAYFYTARTAVLPQDRFLLEEPWMKANVSDQGPLGHRYRVWGDGVFSERPSPGDQQDYFGFRDLTREQLQAMGYRVFIGPMPAGSWISEGDTPIMMNLIDNGLRGYQDKFYGGWGGRAAQDVNPATGTPNSNYAASRFFNAAQQDFATRLRWSVTPSYAGANHEPVVNVNGPLNISAAPGETVRLSATASDPDGNALTYKWWQYTDADTYPGQLALSTPDTLSTSFEVPTNSVIPPNATPGQTIHLILEVTDNGTPALKSYQRVIVTVAARATTTVTSSVTPTLGLTLGGTPSLGAFVVGTAATYSATSTATVTSTAGDATLSVGDPSPLATGRMVNGSSALQSPLRVKAASPTGTGGDFAPLTALSAPLTLLTYSGPVTRDVVTVSYQQAIGATDALRSGTYGKTLSFTLATTTP